ncbi:type 1 fimbrial major subunit FimA [Kalamiella sp. sgz302252]|uniref:type 1 fimbrial major subunit FimA n=1 Tax=Pantoea sp. sgz302252 TaxID=3341827 RepID=UPI0036D414DF
MKMKKLAVIMGAVVALGMGVAHAESQPTTTQTVNGGTVHFKGKLVAAPCAISTDTKNQEVKLGEYTTHHFKTAGSLGSVVPFEIKLEDCDTTVASAASVAFSGREDAQDATLLAIDQDLSSSNNGTATNIGIQILDNASKVVKLDGTTFTDKTTLMNGENILKFAAQYKSTGVATAGDANADANFIMQYN